MKIAYIRVSTIQQNEERQLALMKEQGVERIFIDKASGKDFERPEFQEMLKMLRNGDTIYFESVSRLSRNARETFNMVSELKNMKVGLVFLKENLTLSHDDKGLSKVLSEMFLAMLSSFSEWERESMLDRQKMGLERAKAAHLMGPKSKLTENKWDYLCQKMQEGVPLSKIAQDINHSKHAVYFWVKLHKEGKIERKSSGLYLNGKKLAVM